MTVIKFKITNLTCEACVKLSTMALETIPGVSQIKIDPATGESELATNQEAGWGQISSALRSVGKNAALLP